MSRHPLPPGHRLVATDDGTTVIEIDVYPPGQQAPRPGPVRPHVLEVGTDPDDAADDDEPAGG